MNQSDTVEFEYQEFKKNLLPIGQRVRYKSNGYGSGTIVAYFLTGYDNDGKGIVSQDFPYRVRFDISHVPNVKQLHPRGFEGIFRADSIIALDPKENIFIGAARIMGRMWIQDLQKWTQWHAVTDEIFAEMQKETETKIKWEFCIR